MSNMTSSHPLKSKSKEQHKLRLEKFIREKELEIGIGKIPGIGRVG